MNTFTILPMEWDMKHSDKVNEFCQQGKWTPCDIPELVGQCGYIWPIHTKTAALRYLSGLKKQFPYVIFHLFSGNRACDLELIKEL